MTHIVHRAAVSLFDLKSKEETDLSVQVVRLVLMGLRNKFKVTIEPRDEDLIEGAKCLQGEDPTLSKFSWEDCPPSMKEYYKSWVYGDFMEIINQPEN